MKAVKIWRCRKPQKTTNQKKLGNIYCKLLFCVKSELDQPLRNFLAATGAEIRVGKPTRGRLEREAVALLARISK